MLDYTVRLAFAAILGLVLTLAVLAYARFVYGEFSGTEPIVIDPLTVIDHAGKGNDELGKALAQMLQSRVQSLARELKDAHAGFTTEVREAAVARSSLAGPVGDVRLWTQAVTLQTGLLQPIDMKVSVGGVDVGGMLPWLQRALSSRRILHFTLYTTEADAQVLGSLAPLGLSDVTLRIRLQGPNGKAPSFDAIVDGLAYEIVHQHLAQDTTSRLDVLDPLEFKSLAELLVGVAQANRKSIRGRAAQAEFAAILPAITMLADKVPDWVELSYLAARVADSSRNTNVALTYYRRVQPRLDETKQAELVGWIRSRISELGVVVVEAPVVSEGPLPPNLDYSADIKFVRDSGNEGSVVGLALATALEFQIAKAKHRDQRVSARYIYYAARRVGGLDVGADTGAQIKDGIAALAEKGAVAEDVWPYRPGRYAEQPPATIDSAEKFRIADTRTLTSLDEVKQALKTNGPVVAGISLFESAMTVPVSKTGELPLPKSKEQIVGGHAIVIIGFDDEKRRVKFVNSWGTAWGERGFGYVPYDYLKKHMSDAWTFRLREG